MIEIMNKARINYSSLKIVDDISVELKPETRSFFDKLISDFRINDSSENAGKLLAQHFCFNDIISNIQCK